MPSSPSHRDTRQSLLCDLGLLPPHSIQQLLTPLLTSLQTHLAIETPSPFQEQLYLLHTSSFSSGPFHSESIPSPVFLVCFSIDLNNSFVINSLSISYLHPPLCAALAPEALSSSSIKTDLKNCLLNTYPVPDTISSVGATVGNLELIEPSLTTVSLSVP